MRLLRKNLSPDGKLIEHKLDPGVFVVEVPEVGRRISLGQPPDVVKRFQQAGFAGERGVTTFLLVDSKTQGDSISWSLIEFPVLYALYYVTVEVGVNRVPSFFAGRRPMIVGLENDVRNALRMIKYGNYGVDRIEELDALDVPAATRDALRGEILGLAVGNEIKQSEAFLQPVYLEPRPLGEHEFTDLGDGIHVGRLGFNLYRFTYGDDQLDVDVSLERDESFRSPIDFKHLKFPVSNFGVWHTGEFDGMDPYFSTQHTTLIHKYEPLLIDYPANMTEVINHHGLSKHSINTVFLTHNHDDHMGAAVELFRRASPCHIITTEPVRYSMVKKLAALLDLPEGVVQQSFRWTILPFRKDQPYCTENFNLDGLHVTGHLSCHSVPTTVYTFHLNLHGYDYSYGHFLDIVAFRRMEHLAEGNWMPPQHLAYLHNLIRETRYDLIKYDAGCVNDQALPFTVHGQWQDLVGAATERPFRVFTHAPRHLLDPAHQHEGRYVSLGDLDAVKHDVDRRRLRVGSVGALPAFFMTARRAVLSYFVSLLGSAVPPQKYRLMRHYADAFATCPKQPDVNIGAFLFEQGDESRDVIVLVRGRAEIIVQDNEGGVTFRSTIGDGEVVGDLGVLASRRRNASVKALNRLTYLAVPANLFLEAMHALGVTYEGLFRDVFERRLIFQSAQEISLDVPTTVLNRIGQTSRVFRVKDNQAIYSRGDRDTRLIIAPGDVDLLVGDHRERVEGPTVIGECEFFLGERSRPPTRLHSAIACDGMQLLSFSADSVRQLPVLVDNIRRLIRYRRPTVYRSLPEIDPSVSF
ncbi:MAG: cyclic nucleotide-binding domain-containing protein [Candidatus Lambdaproteobacteria bacterium]|nr:cyclic nucleotide-binding domain-containing protein [Candidatus Lambdaproteobacteria bacterium]